MPIFDKTWTKDPDANTDYIRNWSRWLAAGDTIASSSWSITGTPTISAQSFTDESATVWVDGGVDGEVVYVTNSIVTVGGRDDDRTFRLIIRQR